VLGMYGAELVLLIPAKRDWMDIVEQAVSA
jgi:hypothetical protein